MTEAIYTEPLTVEEDSEARLRQVDERDHSLLPAFESKGVRVASRGRYDLVVLNPEALGLEPPSTDEECRELSLPRVRRRGLYLPANGQTLTPLEVCDRWMKTPEKKREFLLGCTKAPALTRYVAIEAGAEFERLGLATASTAKVAEELALKKARAKPGEPCRAVLVECRDDQLAAEIVETLRDSLPWAEGLELRPDGSLSADWHGGALNREEKLRLRDQQGEDHRAKRARRAKVIRSMEREPL
jgi:hypothetical protein